MQYLVESFQQTYEVDTFPSTHDVKGETKHWRFRDLSNEKLRVLNNRLHFFVKVPNLENPCKLYGNHLLLQTLPHVLSLMALCEGEGHGLCSKKVHGEENLRLDSGSATFQPHGLSSVP